MPIKKFNEDAKFVNKAILDHCISTKKFQFIDNDSIFENTGSSLYDARDPSGVHVNDTGAESLYDNLAAFLEDGLSDEVVLATPRNKRLRSQDSQPSPSNQRVPKQGKTTET